MSETIRSWAGKKVGEVLTASDYDQNVWGTKAEASGRVPTGICRTCGAFIEHNDGGWWTFNTCRQSCDATYGPKHEPIAHLTAEEVQTMWETGSRQPKTKPVEKGRKRSDAAKQVFGG